MNKKLLALLLALAMMFTLAACGGEEAAPPAGDEQPAAGDTVEPPAEGGDGQEVELSKSRVADIFEGVEKLYMVMQLEQDLEMGDGPELVKLTIAIDGEDYYIDTDAPISGHYTMLTKDNVSYIITHSDKTYMATPLDEDEDGEEDVPIEEGMFFLSQEALANIVVSTEEFNGKTYDVESVSETSLDGETFVNKYFFDGDELVYIVNGDSVTEVLECSDKVDASLFEVPADYQEIDMSEFYGDIDLEGLEGLEGLEELEGSDGAKGN